MRAGWNGVRWSGGEMGRGGEGGKEKGEGRRDKWKEGRTKDER